MFNNSSPLQRRKSIQAARWLAAAGVTGVILSACGGSSSSSSSSSTDGSAANGGQSGTPTHLLNTKRVAVAIEASITSERQLKSKVTCPKAVPQQKGRTFTCVAHTKMHNKPVKTVFTVVQKNDSGKVNYASPK
jgi:hypothetical protein